MVQGLTISANNEDNRLSTTMIFIWLDRLVRDTVSGGVDASPYPS